MYKKTIIAAIIGITCFVAILYKKHQWDMNEQRYKVLKQKIRN